MTDTKECDIIMARQYAPPTYEKADAPEGSKGSFFVRLAYGYVEHKLGMNTAKMTTDEVIKEFLNAKGSRTPNDFFKNRFKGKEEPKKEETKAKPKTEAEFKEQKKRMLDDTRRIVYARVVTKKKLERALDVGQNGMGELTARLFNEDAFGIKADQDNETGAYYRPIDNATNFKMNSFGFNEYFDIHEEGGTFYHECWHAIDNNYSTYSQKDRYGFVTSDGNLSIDYVLSTGKTFQQTLLQEYQKMNFDALKDEIDAEKEVYFKEKYGMTRQEARNKYEELLKKSNELFDNAMLAKDTTLTKKLYEEWQEFTKSTEYLEAKRIRNVANDFSPPAKMMRKWADMSDVVNGATKGNETLVGVGHRRDYWNSWNADDRRAKECFAEIASSLATNPESYDVFKKWLPETVKAFEEIHGKLDSGEIKSKGRTKYEY